VAFWGCVVLANQIRVEAASSTVCDPGTGAGASHYAVTAAKVKKERGLFLVTDIESLLRMVFPNNDCEVFALSWRTALTDWLGAGAS